IAVGKAVGRCQQAISRVANGRTMMRVRLVTILPEPVSRLLTKAAERRQMAAGDLAAQLLGGVICRGAIDKTLQRWNAYEAARRLTTADSHNTKQRKRANGEADMARDHLGPSEV